MGGEGSMPCSTHLTLCYRATRKLLPPHTTAVGQRIDLDFVISCTCTCAPVTHCPADAGAVDEQQLCYVSVQLLLGSGPAGWLGLGVGTSRLDVLVLFEKQNT